MDKAFSVVEEKTTGLRRRWIAWPRDERRDDHYEAHAPLLHISHYLPPVMAEAASCVELKASFFRSLLLRGLGISFDAAWRTARWWSSHGSQWDTRPAQKFSTLLLLRQLRGDDGGSPPPGCTSIGAYRRMDR
ncbi:target of rapamycin (TOR) kinase 1 [Trypanosoma cruzi]|nr:target of rapamycin (TOR) kinase 1 [Trypanosoma cruzi]